jgi:molybdate transport system ATP-binding protein
MKLRLDHVRLHLGAFELQIDATFDERTSGIFGPSGSGKTSLLNLIAGLRRSSAGRVQLEETILFDSETRVHLPPRERRIGYVPQDLALFPHLNVRQNLAYGCPRPGTEDAIFTLDHVTEVMEIAPLLERDVTTLSGGEQQRVAFARAILSAPRLLLLDEPMTSLDSKLKKRLIPFLLRIRDEFRIPLIYVTHDAAELTALADEVIILDRGRIIQRGPPAEALADET